MGVRKELKKDMVKARNAVLRRFPNVRTRVREFSWSHKQKKYDELKATIPVNPKKVVFEAFGGRKYVDSPKAIYKAMCRDPYFDDWEFVWSFSNPAAKFNEYMSLQRATCVRHGSEEYQRAMASTKYIVQNARLPEWLYPKEDQVFVQCWHGTPLKRLGFDVEEKEGSGGALNTATQLAERFKLDCDKWTYLLSPSPYTSQHLADAFGLEPERRPSTILEEGYPRNDKLVNVLKADYAEMRIKHLKEFRGIPRDKKVLLFAPTWRDDEYKVGVGYTSEMPVDFDLLQSELGDEWIILLRMHYYIANKLDLSKWKGFVYNASNMDDINDLYLMADALCTDYSSVFYDYANTGRPIMFYWRDREHYQNELHGFYMDPDDIPGPKTETPEDFAAAVKAMDSWYDTYGEAYKQFRATFCPKDDGHATHRVIKRVFKANEA